MKKKTKWLSEMSDPYCSQALKNMTAEDTGVIILSDAIIEAFYWDASPEGHDYWQKVYDKAKRFGKV
jgi:hypothetical protein